MATAFFNVESIDLSMRSPETGDILRSNVYTLEGVKNVDGSLREMSIGQLVMAVCLQRATDVEAQIFAMMNEMATNTDKLDRYSRVETDLASWQKANPNATLTASSISGSTTYKALAEVFGNPSARAEYLSSIGMSDAESWSSDEVDKLMENTEKAMDSLNTISQEQLIEIQSLTSKRDDTYSLISNVLKSLYTVLTGNVNNL